MPKMGRHKSVDRNLRQSISWLKSLDGVSKVVLNRTDNCRHKFTPGHLRIQRIDDAGLHINAYGGNGVVVAFVRIKPIEMLDGIRDQIEAKFKD